MIEERYIPMITRRWKSDGSKNFMSPEAAAKNVAKNSASAELREEGAHRIMYGMLKGWRYETPLAVYQLVM